jgi:hypothetical protein
LQIDFNALAETPFTDVTAAGSRRVWHFVATIPKTRSTQLGQSTPTFLALARLFCVNNGVQFFLNSFFDDVLFCFLKKVFNARRILDK